MMSCMIFVRLFFRTYIENFDEFNWLRGTNFKKTTDKEND